jgi:LuxR family quorum-sensing system transcriptional regulator CciR
MTRWVDDFDAAASRCTSLDELKQLIDRAARDLGFDYFALLHHASVGDARRHLIRLDNYPAGWAREFVGNGFAADDPVHLASARVNTGFAWSELNSLIRLGPRQQRILRRSRRHGIGAGFTVPVNVPGEPGGSCSFAVSRGRDLPQRRLMFAELIGGHAFRAARRLKPPPVRRPPHLSTREIECLRLVALGKTDWEIARILGLSVHTAHQYVKRARAAYDTVSRTQLVVYALRDSWISFEEAIPPCGGMG